MTLDLSRTLHTAVDAGDNLDQDLDLDLDLRSVAARVRRRRHVRAGVRAGVGVAAAGAVAVTATHLPSTVGGLLAAHHSEPGSCGTDVTTLPFETSPTAQLQQLNDDTPFEDVTPSFATSQPGTTLGRYVGDTFGVSTYVPVDATQAAHYRELLAQVQHEDLAQAQQLLADAKREKGPNAQQDVADAQARLDDVQTGTLLSFPRSSGDLQLYLTRGDTVVGTYTAPDTAVSTLSDDDVLETPLAAPLVACSDGRPLGAGTYGVYLGYGEADGGAPTAVAGPWQVTVVRPAAVTGLPAGFPTSVPLIGGRLDSVKSVDGGGWVVTVAVDANDALTTANGLLEDAGWDSQDGVFRPSSQESWEVQLDRPHPGDGTPIVRYEVTPHHE